MKKCTKCNLTFESDKNFCIECGAKLSVISNEQPNPKFESRTESSANEPDTHIVEPIGKKKISNKGIIIALAVIILVLFVFRFPPSFIILIAAAMGIGFYFYSKRKKGRS